MSGRALASVPGQAARVPAAGAEVRLLETGQTARTDSSGSFLLEGIARESGQVLFRFDSNGDGEVDRQKLMSLEALKAGPGRQVNVGDVLLVENAQVRGRVLRGDVGTQGSGHAGSLAFVPEAPYSALVNDDGSFVLTELPEGSLRIAFFRSGFATAGFTDVQVTAGQEVSLREVVLQPLPPTPVEPALLTGKLVLQPAEGVLAQTVVQLQAPGGMPLDVNFDESGAFSVSAQPGIYSLSVQHPAYGSARVDNLFLVSGPRDLGDLVLVQGSMAAAPPGPTAGDGGTLGSPYAPVAVFGQTVVIAGSPMAQLDGTRSYDPLDGGPLSYRWVETSDAGLFLSPNDSLLAGRTQFAAPSSPRDLEFALVVTSQSGRTSLPAKARVEVVSPPTVSPTFVHMQPDAGFDLTASWPGAAAASYSWSVTSGNVQLAQTTGSRVTVLASPTTGNAVVRCQASVAGASTAIDVPIVVEALPPPQFTFDVMGGTSQVVLTGAPVTLKAKVSFNYANPSLDYAWSTNAGVSLTPSGDQVAFIAPNVEGAVTVTLQVTDLNSGISDFIDITLQVVDGEAPKLFPPLGTIVPWWSFAAGFDEPLYEPSVTATNVRLKTMGGADVSIDVRLENNGRRIRVTPRAPVAPGDYTVSFAGVTDASARRNKYAGAPLPITIDAPTIESRDIGKPTSGLLDWPSVVATEQRAFTISSTDAGVSYEEINNGANSAANTAGGFTVGRRGVSTRRQAAYFAPDGTAQPVLYGFGAPLTAPAAMGGLVGNELALCASNDRLGLLRQSGATVQWEQPFLTGASPTLEPVVTPTFMAHTGAQAVACAAGEGGQLAVVGEGPAAGFSSVHAYLKAPGATGFTELAPAPVIANPVLVRAVLVGTTPVVCVAHNAQGLRLSCAAWVGAGFITTIDVIGRQLDVENFDLAPHGSGAFLTAISGGNRLEVFWLTVGAAGVTPQRLDGPNGSTSWNYDGVGCVPRNPEVTATATDLFVSFAEVCSLEGFVQRLQWVKSELPAPAG